LSSISLFLLFYPPPFFFCIFCIFSFYLFFCFLSLFLPIFIYLSFLFILHAVFSLTSHFILSSLLSPHQFYFKLFQLYLCFHSFVASCKSKGRFPSHVVMRRAS
jgi:hypothetical protein